MHIVVTADVHLDAGRWGRTSASSGRNTAWESAERCWDAVCDHAIEHGAAALVVAGDAFLHGKPSPEALESFADGLRRVARHARIPCVVLGGNHEWIGVPSWHRNCLARLTDIDGVHVHLDAGTVHLDGLPPIAVLPWPRRSTLARHLDLERLSPAEADLEIGAWLCDQIDTLAGAADGPAVLVGHATVGEAAIGTDRRGSELVVHQVFSEPTIPVDVFVDGPWHAVELGHIHRRQSIDPAGRVNYVGSPDRVDFGEENQPKGFTVLKIGSDDVQRDFIETPARVFRTLTVDRPDPDIDDIEPGSLIRLVLADAAIDHAPLRRRLGEHHCEVLNVVTPATVIQQRTTSHNVGEDVTVADGLDLWLVNEAVPAETAVRVRNLAAELLEANP